MIKIREGDIKTAVELSRQIEVFENPHGADEYQKRMKGKPKVILIAYDHEKPVGFKVGYEKDGYFYSWMGGVLKKWRRKGIARALADHQESWAKQQGYTSITFKTRNNLKPMLLFGIRNGFDIIGLEKQNQVSEHRILLRKQL